MASRPVIVVLQGAYQTAEFYHDFEAEVQLRGFQVVHPILPTCSNPGDEQFPTKTISDDAAVVKAEVQDLLAKDRDVAIFLHSYGGLVGSEAILQSMSRGARKADGLKGGVYALIFCSAFVLQQGSSVAGTFDLPQDDGLHLDGRYTFRDAESRLFNDLNASQRAKWASKIIPHSSRTHDYIMNNCAWKYIPTVYIVLEEDKCVSPQAQEMMSGMIGATVDRFNAGHLAIISRPADLAEKLVTLVSATTASS